MRPAPKTHFFSNLCVCVCQFIHPCPTVRRHCEIYFLLLPLHGFWGSGDQAYIVRFSWQVLSCCSPCLPAPRPIFQGRVLEAESTPPHVPLQSRICCPTPVTFPVWLCPNPQGKDSLTWRIHWADKARSCRPSRLFPGSWTRLRGSGNGNWDLQSKSGLREAG